MGDVRALKTEKDEWAERAVQEIEKALGMAKSQPMESVAVLMLSRGGERHLLFSSMDVTAASGALFTAAVEMARID